MKKRFLATFALVLTVCLLLSGCEVFDRFTKDKAPSNIGDGGSVKVVGYASVEGIPDYSGSPYTVLNDNKPEFSDSDLTATAYESYSELDELGRCGVTIACVGVEIMPTEKRESISSVKPTGWVNNKYDADLVDGEYIYNRCHLIGFQLTGENANKQNLITGTRYMNVEGMLPFEDMVADYVKETKNHVLYRVTPIFVGNNLLASGVKLEAFSVEDSGDGVCFCVFVYNVQPGITINYANGDNWLNDNERVPVTTENSMDSAQIGGGSGTTYVINTKSKKIHLPTCSAVEDILEENRDEYIGSKKYLLDHGYMICGICKP